MKNVPFTFGKVVDNENFTNREEETKILLEQFEALNNVVIISPRRWGKTSLVKHAANKLQLENSTFKVVYLDLFNIKTEEDFYKEYTHKVINTTINKFEDLVNKSSEFFKNLIPKLSYTPVPESEFSIGLEWNEIKKRPDDILNLPNSIASKEGYKILFCIDEFQNLNHFENPMAFQKKLRAQWQHHRQVSYCLYGSKEHMMQDIFNNTQYPFYRFAFIMNLQKIKEDRWYSFITDKFESAGKIIHREAIEKLIDYADNQPYYVQQLAQTAWLLTKKDCDSDIIEAALENIFEQLSTFYLREMDELSLLQVNFLHAIVDEVKNYGSSKNIEKYELRTTANISRIKKSMKDKQILRFVRKDADFHDPIFKLWLKKYYFI